MQIAVQLSENNGSGYTYIIKMIRSTPRQYVSSSIVYFFVKEATMWQHLHAQLAAIIVSTVKDTCRCGK